MVNLYGNKKRAFVLGTRTDVLVNNGGTPVVWEAEVTGLYRLVGWGAATGISNSNGVGGASGAFFLAERRLITGAQLSVLVGRPGAGNTTITLPDGTVFTAGGSTSLNVVGVASVTGVQLPGDILLNGSPGASSFGQSGSPGLGDSGGLGGNSNGATGYGGGGAPGAMGYGGGKGSDYNQYNAGHGGGASMNSHLGGVGGSGLVIIELLRG